MPVTDIPANKNFLSPLGFKFVLARAPNLNFRVQDVRLPGVQLGEATVPTPFVAMPKPGKLTYSPLTVTFRVSEDLDDYLEIYNWMINLGATENFEQYKSLTATAPGNPTTVYSDMTLIIMNSAMRSNIQVTFKDAFPINLGDLEFNTTDTDVNYIQTTADFRFMSYSIKLVD
jgi:hypothetical protein